MVRKQLLGASVNHLIKELSPEIPEGKEPEIENAVSAKLRSVLGENWALLPVSGPYMMIVVLILNYILLPMGITPVTVADRAISKSRDMDLDHRFEELLESAKSSAHTTGEFTSDKMRELTAYSEEKGKEIGKALRATLENGLEVSKSLLTKGKSLGTSMIGSLKKKFEEGEEEEKKEDEPSTK